MVVKRYAMTRRTRTPLYPFESSYFDFSQSSFLIFYYVFFHTTLGPTRGAGASLRLCALAKALWTRCCRRARTGGDTWEVENLKETKEVVKKIDTEMSLKG
jgi:hypothetical protein